MLTRKRLLLLNQTDPNLLFEDLFNGAAVNTNLWTVTDTYASEEQASNIGFETAGGGGADVFANWNETISGTGADITQTTTAGEFRSGSAAAKLTRGDIALGVYLSQTLTVYSSRSYIYTFWTRGDGTNAGQYDVYDFTNSAYIVPVTSTDITGTTFTQVTVAFTTPSNCTSIGIVVLAPPVTGGIAYFDDVSLKATTGLISVSGGALQIAGGRT